MQSAPGNTMTMTTAMVEGEVVIGMAGTGTAVIDWGDGSAPETVTLSASSEHWEFTDSQRYTHTFPKTTSCTIVIDGQNITHLLCCYLQLTDLDVSNNTVLKTLYCFVNRLTNLDVSQNTALTLLSCGDNRLTSLDVSNNTALTELYCGNNPLTAEGLNALFGTLHDNTGDKTIYISNNFGGAVGYDWSIATDKGWKLK